MLPRASSLTHVILGTRLLVLPWDGLGVPNHHRDQAKLWRMIEPENASRMNTSMLAVSMDTLAKNPELSRVAAGYCAEQRPGDVLYIPAGWFHATRNRGVTVGMSYMAGASFRQQQFWPGTQPPMYGAASVHGQL